MKNNSKHGSTGTGQASRQKSPRVWARRYARMGWPVLPLHWSVDGRCSCGKADCSSPGKHPIGDLVPHGVKDATTDEDLINEWWERHPSANIGVATGAASGIVVLDVDERAGDEWLEEHCGTLCTLKSNTGKGSHYFFRHPGTRVKNSVKRIPGLDIKGDGGYVVVPSSRHINGRRYTWDQKSHPPSPDALADIPRALMERLIQSSASRAHSAPATDETGVIPEKRRNDTLFRTAKSFVTSGIAHVDALEFTRAINESRCKPPLDDAEVVRTVESAYKHATVSTAVDYGKPVRASEAPPVESIDWVCPDLLLAGEPTLIVGEGASFKTTFMLEICRAVASGDAPFGHAPFRGVAGRVLYVTEEDSLDVLVNRLRALAVAGHPKKRKSKTTPKQRRNRRLKQVLPNVYVWVRPGGLLSDSHWQQELLKVAEDIGPRLIVLDPLSAMLPDESSNPEASLVMRFIRTLADTTGAAVAIVHHPGKFAKGKRFLDLIRGASAYNAASRAIFFLKRQDDGAAVQCLKMSRSVFHPKFRIRLEVRTRENDHATWRRARLSYRDQAEWERDRAEELVIRLLTESAERLTSTELKRQSKGSGVPVIDVSAALKHLCERGEIAYEKGPRNAKYWYVTSLPGRKGKVVR